MNNSLFLALRAVLAVVLMIGFYLLALAIGGGLLFAAYAQVAYAHRFSPKLLLICIFGGGAILWAVLPRFDKFTPPGPKLERDQHPELFKELEGVARATQQEMPSEVYAVANINAWVAQRGGIMGFGSRRVMGLGLPLMRMLTCAQFRAVLAHEFGHYHGGDTKVGPWIYKTRGAIGRTVDSLSQSSVLQAPFRWYGLLFLRITHAISRRQEFVADELAARTVGSRPLIDGLRTVHAVGPVFNLYWHNECAPVLEAGFRPPLAEGFSQFVRVGRMAEAINQHLEEELKTGKVNPYDTHPPLKERIAAVEGLPPGDTTAAETPASALLTDIGGVENQLLAALAGAATAEKLQPIDWSEVTARVYQPRWVSLVKANREGLTGVTPESLPQRAKELREFEKRFAQHEGQSMAGAVVGAALAVMVVNRGGVAEAGLGQTVSVRLGDTSFEPFSIFAFLIDGKLTAEDWEKSCRALGILGQDLALAEPGKAAPPPVIVR